MKKILLTICMVLPTWFVLGQAPGGVTAAVWYKADAGVYSNAGTTLAADNATVQQWNDQMGTGYNLAQATAGQRPTFSNQSMLANFNPTVSFNADFMAADPGSGNAIINRVQGSIYITGKMNAIGAAGLAGFDGTMDYPGLHTSQSSPNDKLLFYSSGSGYTTNSTNSFTAVKSFVAGSSWLNGAGAPASNLLAKVWLDGNENVYNNTNGNVNTTNATRAFRIGGDTNWGSINGQLNEVIVFANPLSASEKSRVDSYLSVKWGSTLLGDYVSSGNTVVWAASATYQNNIFGIARDNNSALYQKQSRSENPYQKLIIGVGNSLANTNAANTNTLADGQFLIVGDNGLKQSLAVPMAYTAGSNGETNYRFESIWKVQNTNNIGTVTVAWPKSVKNLYLVQSPDAVFDATDTFTPMATEVTVNGVVYNTANVTLTDGEFFTFTGFGNAPGGVATDLSYWYRADVDAANTGAATDVTSWKDVWNGTTVAQLGTNALPKYVMGASNYFNFNPGINFTANTQTLGNNTVRTLTNLDYDVFTFTKEGTTHGGGNPRIFSTGMDNTTTGSANWDGFGIWPAPFTALERRPYGGTTQFPNVNPGFDGSIPSIMYFRNTNTTSAKGLNGAAMATPTTFSAVGSMFGGHIFGDTRFSSNSSDNAGFIGHIGETIVYGAGTLSNTERRKVDSYLAIKYGITLGQVNTDHYLDADGALVWNGGTNTTYNNNIFGVAREDIGLFEQKVSKSVNAGTILTLATSDDFVNPNLDAARTGFVNDKTYFLLGDNNVTTASLNNITVSGINYKRIQRTWLSQRKNNTGDLYFHADLSAYGIDFSLLNDVLIMIADDENFTVNVRTVSGLNEMGKWIHDYNFDTAATNQYITYAVKEVQCLPNFVWSSPVAASGNTATGTINGIAYTYASNSPVLTSTQIFNGFNVFPNSASAGDIFSFPRTSHAVVRNTQITNNTITFATPVEDPVLVFSSLGNSGVAPVPVIFGQAIELLWSGSNGANGFVSWDSPTQITGREGYAIVRVPGTHTSISFNYTAAENYANFLFGIAEEQNCLCYKPGITVGTALDTKVGITALSRAGADNSDNWPMTRKGGWLVLEAKTKAFVPNRVVFSGGNPVGIAPANFLEGMMVYDDTNKCMKMYTQKEGDASMAWHCITTQTCPD